MLFSLFACSPTGNDLGADLPTQASLAVSASSTPFQPGALTDTPLPPAVLSTETPTLTLSPTAKPLVPQFAHIVILIFENKEYGTIIGNTSMPNYNRYAQEYTLLNAHYAVSHPSLPNYLALIGGDTFGITSDCIHCYVDAQSLPDLIEASGRTWRSYQERMPSPCYLGDTLKYVQKHDPFIYFTPIRENTERCQKDVVPLTQLDKDLAAQALPDFVFITPDICNSAHDCPPSTSDTWLGTMVPKLQDYLDATAQPYWVILTWDEGQGDHSCCGLPEKAGGRVPTVLISPQARRGFQDETPYTHYSILKTIAKSWGLPYLGHAADDENVLISTPWQ